VPLLVEQAQQTVATFDRMADVIVSDYAKLSGLGPDGIDLLAVGW